MNQTTTKTLYVETIFWRECDALLSVAGYDRKQVKDKADALAEEEIALAVEQEIESCANPEEVDAEEIQTRLTSGFCSTGIHPFSSTEIDSLGIPKENLAELESDGITVY
jgi:hypothetical protein